MQVIKNNGKLEPFQPAKIRQWVQWALEGQNDIKKQIEMEHHILSTTISRLPEQVKTSDIQDTMVRVCLDKEDIEYSRVAANIEKANILKNQSRLLGVFKPETTDFDEYLELFEEEGIWKGDWIQDVKDNAELVNDWYIELESRNLEYWTIKQWADKYSLKRNKLAIETPALGCLAISIAYHGVTQLAFDFARDLLYYKTNLPTPALNGVRNGDFNSISCCVIEGGDSVESIGVAQHIAGEMTAKKAGIGITLDTRSTGDPVRGGRVEHLGKRPLYVAIEKEVKKFTQETRGGSATMTIKCIDPDIMGLLLLKTQKIDLSKRVDKIDYSFAYNDDFVKAILNDDDWYLFSKHLAPEVHDNFHKVDYMKYVKKAIRNKIPYTKVKALDVLIKFIEARWETGRMYCINLTRVNLHTPFLDPIKQSNLCMEINLPTKPFIDMKDLYGKDFIPDLPHFGEVAFCALAALNVANISFEEYFEVAERALRTVDKMIERAPAMCAALGFDLRRRRSVGIGITGLASLLYKEGLDYDGSPESIDFTEEVAELHYYALLKASQKLAKEDNFSVDGIDTNWLPIDTMISNREPLLDWELLRGNPRKHSVLVAHMPTESSAVN